MTLPCRECDRPVKVKRQKNRRVLTAPLCKECRRESRTKFATSALSNPLHEKRLAAHINRMEQIIALTKAANINIASAEAGVVDERLGNQVSFNY